MNNSSEGGWEEVTKGGKLSKVNRIALCEPGKGSAYRVVHLIWCIYTTRTRVNGLGSSVYVAFRIVVI